MKFEKVSFSEFSKALREKVTFVTVLNEIRAPFQDSSEEDIKNLYDNLKFPKRATKYSAGYDFFAPFPFSLDYCDDILIPTGFKIQLDPDKVLLLYPRSSLGMKYNITMSNTVGIIDSDYYNNIKNEGHIFIKLIRQLKQERPEYNINRSSKTIYVSNIKYECKQGEAFSQGIIMQYFLTEDDITTEKRVGGIGSTSVL